MMTAKVFENGKSQAVRLPKECRFDTSAAEAYGKIRADLEKKGIPLGPLDMMIAGHAKSLGYTVVTNNTKEFNRIQGLKIENWVVQQG